MKPTREFNDTDPERDLIPSDDHDPAPYEPKTLAERIRAFDSKVIEAMKTAPPPKPREAPKPVERPILPSLEKLRRCIDCKQDFNGLISICPDCAEARLEIQSEARRLRQKKARSAEWLKICPPAYRVTDWARPELAKACIDLALKWVPGKEAHSLCLYGPPRIGKTRSAFAILARFHEAGWPVYAIHAGDAWDVGAEIRGLSSATREQYDEDTKIAQGAREVLLQSRRASMLLIDDIGKERTGHKGLLSEAVAEAFFSLIEFRIAHKLPTIWTCNSDAETIMSRFGEDKGQPLMKRLFEVSHAPIIE